MVRTVLVFMHVTGAIGVFGALAIEGAVLLQIRQSADSAQLRTVLTNFRLVPRVAVPSLLVTTLPQTGRLATSNCKRVRRLPTGGVDCGKVARDGSTRHPQQPNERFLRHLVHGEYLDFHAGIFA